MGGCRHRSVAVGGSRKRSAAAKRRTARRVYTLHGSATWLGCSPTTGRRAAIFSNGASKINHLWSKKGSSAPVLVCGGWGFVVAAKAWCGDFCFVPHDPIFYAGVLGRGWKETFDRSEPPTLLVTVGVNRYSHFFSFLIKNGPKTLHGRPQRQPWCAYLS